MALHPFANARDTFRFYREITASEPDELTSLVAVVHGPDGSMLAAIVPCYCGSVAAGEAAVQPIKAFGPPVLDALGPMPYPAINQLLDAAYPKGALNYWKSSFLSAPPSDDLIDVIIDCYARVPSPMTAIFLERAHGAMSRVGAGDTAFPHRAVGYNLGLFAEWMNPADTERNIAWTRESYAAMKPFVASGRYVNYLDTDEPGDPAAEAYGPNYARLRQLKTKFDPTNFFHMNQNIRPV